MKASSIILVAASLLVASRAHAQLISIETVYVGDAGNPNDSTGVGAVDYGYHIGKYEVTNAQYATYLNSVAKKDDPNRFSFSYGINSNGGIQRTGISVFLFLWDKLQRRDSANWY